MRRPALIALLLAGPARGQEVHTQDFDLPSGWSAIYLEVEPELNDPETVFAACPGLASVWTFDPRFGSGGLTPGLGEGLLLRTGWFSYFPSSRSESILTNLFGVRAGRAYLVKIDGAEGCTFSIAGTPLLRRTRWTVDDFTLTGFPVEPISPPSFEAYFAPSPAHAGQPVFRLDPSGEWGVAAGSEMIRSGEAYWVFTQGASDYQGPLEVELEISDRIDFGASRTRETLTLHNRLAVQAEVRLTLRPPGAGGVAVPLKRQLLARRLRRVITCCGGCRRYWRNIRMSVTFAAKV